MIDDKESGACRPEKNHKTNNPWNIAADFNIDMSFSSGNIAAMLDDEGILTISGSGDMDDYDMNQVYYDENDKGNGNEDSGSDDTGDISGITIIANGICGDNATWTLDDNGVLTISGSGDMYDFGDTYDENGKFVDTANLS